MNVLGARILIALALMGKDLKWFTEEARCEAATIKYLFDEPGAEPSFKLKDALTRTLDVPWEWLLAAPLGRPLTEAEAELMFLCAHIIRTTMRGARKDGRGEPNARLESNNLNLRVPEAFRSRGARLVARVVGPSLTMLGLLHGDRVFLKPAESARGVAGQVVLFRLNGELYLKRFTVAGAGEVRMENAHFDYDPLVIRKTDELQMLGEVVGCQRIVRGGTNRPVRVRTDGRRSS